MNKHGRDGHATTDDKGGPLRFAQGRLFGAHLPIPSPAERENGLRAEARKNCVFLLPKVAEGRGGMRGYLRRRRLGVRWLDTALEGRECPATDGRSPVPPSMGRSCRFAFRPLAGAAHAVRRSAATRKEGFTQRSRRRAHKEHRETDKGIGSRVTGNGAWGSGLWLVARRSSLATNHSPPHFPCSGFARVSRVPCPEPRFSSHSSLVIALPVPRICSRTP
jgi:hypothetical protein